MGQLVNRIEDWIFDLDNTLYPAKSRLFDQISNKMTLFIMEKLQLNKHEAYNLQKKYFQNHGTTMHGLMINHGTDPSEFLDYVHKIDLSPIEKQNPLLNAALKRLPGRKIIFTNGTVEHAKNVTTHMGILHHFDFIFDIVQSSYKPKPDPLAYKKMTKKLKINAKAAIMIEDMACNLLPAAQLGMATAWIRSETEWATKGKDNLDIDYIIDDLPTWLRKLE